METTTRIRSDVPGPDDRSSKPTPGAQRAPEFAAEKTGGKRPARRLPRVVIVVGAVAVVAGLGLWRLAQVPAEVPAELTLQGNIDVRQVNLSFKVGGRIDSLSVDEGDAVKAGAILATLDQRYFYDDLQLSRAQRDQAAANYERLKNGFRPEEVAQARAVEAERQATVQRATEDFSRARRLRSSNAIGAEEFQHLQSALRESEAQLRSAAASRKLYEIGSRPEDIASGKAQLEASAAQLVAAERRLEDSKLIAPNDGTILTRAREKGAIVNPGETVFTLTLSSPVWVRTYVGEPDLGSVQPGMAVSVTTDAVTGREYAGHVGFISPTAEFTPKTVETRELRTDLVYRLRIVVDDPDGGLRQGMPVTVSVQLSGMRRRTLRERLFEALKLNRLGLTSGRGR